MTPPKAPLRPRSKGLRTIPTIRNRTRGPAGGPGSVAPPKTALTCAGVNDAASRWPPTPRCSCAARLSPIVISSTADGSAARPATIRGRSTTLPSFVSSGATRIKFGAKETGRPIPRPTAKAETSGTRPKARSCADVGSPPRNSCTDAARLDLLNRASAASLRRAPAAVASTTAPTTPTSNVSTTTLRQRRRISHRATTPTAPTSRAPQQRRPSPLRPQPTRARSPLFALLVCPQGGQDPEPRGGSSPPRTQTARRRPARLAHPRDVAEGVGFEPTVSCPTHAFQACRFGRSRIPPEPKDRSERRDPDRPLLGRDGRSRGPLAATRQWPLAPYQARRHSSASAESCFLPDLTRFTGARRAGPDMARAGRGQRTPRR